MLNNLPLILITGATCSGKSGLSIKLAKKLDAQVVSIDSVQVYKDFDIGSAKVTKSEMQGVKHHMLSVWQPQEKFNVAKYLKLVDEVISNIFKEGSKVIIAGGTTMYVTSLIHGLADIPKQDEKLRERLEKKSTQFLYKLLSRIDKHASIILNQNDRSRIVRALEVKILSKKSIKDIQKEHRFSNYKYDCLGYVICQKREELYKKINLRVEMMLKEGLVEETKELLLKYDKSLPPFSSIGYKQVVSFLENELSYNEMLEDIAKCTRHLAKRQMTYLRNEPLKRGWDVYPKSDDKNAVLLQSDDSNIQRKDVIKDFLVYNFNFEELVRDIELNLKNGIKGVKLSYISPRSLI